MAEREVEWATRPDRRGQIDRGRSHAPAPREFLDNSAVSSRVEQVSREAVPEVRSSYGHLGLEFVQERHGFGRLSLRRLASWRNCL